MLIKAKLRYLRISPRKVRLVADLIKGLTVKEAEGQLKFLVKKSARPILKLLNSAIANAQNSNLTKENLKISNIFVDSGPSLKRWRARAMGRAAPILKRTSHVTLILEGKETSASLKSEEKEIKKTEEEPVKKQLLEEIKEIKDVEKDKGQVQKPKSIPPSRPYPTTSQSKKRFFSRQTFGNVKKYFRRKSI